MRQLVAAHGAVRGAGRQHAEAAAVPGRPASELVIDYLCNAFTPDRAAVWDAALRRGAGTVKIRRDGDDDLTEPDAMVARMDELGVETVLLPTGDLDDGEFT